MVVSNPTSPSHKSNTDTHSPTPARNGESDYLSRVRLGQQDEETKPRTFWAREAAHLTAPQHNATPQDKTNKHEVTVQREEGGSDFLLFTFAFLVGLVLIRRCWDPSSPTLVVGWL